MLIDVLQALGGVMLVCFAGDFLVRGAAGLALRFDIPVVVVGLTVVAFGTSAPELAVSLEAGASGLADVAVANVVGSNICNVGLVLGLASLFKPLQIHTRVLRWDLPILLVVSTLCVGLLLDHRIVRWEGMLLLAVLAAWLLSAGMMMRADPAQLEHEFDDVLPARRDPVPVQSGMILGGVIGLAVGGELLIGGAVGIARNLEVSDAVIGLTLVALGTSLPELVTSVIAAWRGHTDLAVGNVVGSNLFNILAILGVTGSIFPLEIDDIGYIEYGALIVSALALLLVRSRRHGLTAAHGLVLLLAYFSYVGWRSVSI